jgi:hypothetical protein
VSVIQRGSDQGEATPMLAPIEARTGVRPTEFSSMAATTNTSDRRGRGARRHDEHTGSQAEEATTPERSAPRAYPRSRHGR